MKLIDTHSHLYSESFEGEHNQMIKRAFEAGLEKIFMPNIDSSSIEFMKAINQTYPDQCMMMMGMHPCSVKENVEDELKIIQNALEDGSPYYAVGEIGIDLYWEKSFLKQQEWAFREQIKWAKAKSLPIVIHCREAFDEILAILDEVNDDDLSGIFHCFTGTVEQAKHILSYGNFKLGIGGVVTFKNSGLDKVVQQLDLKDLVLETDAPYLAPVPYRGKRNESLYLVEVAKKLAELFEVSLDEVASQTSKNAEEIFYKNKRSDEK